MTNEMHEPALAKREPRTSGRIVGLSEKCRRIRQRRIPRDPFSPARVACLTKVRTRILRLATTDHAGNVDLVFLALEDKPFGTVPGAGVVHYDAYFTQSTDGGGSFSTPVKISSVTSDPDGSSTLDLSAQDLGDYITAAADSRGGKVFAVWTDSRNATPCSCSGCLPCKPDGRRARYHHPVLPDVREY